MQTHQSHFHRCTAAGFMANIGLAIEEATCAHTKHCRPNRISPKELIVALHFAWQHPTQHAAAAVFKMGRTKHSGMHWRPIILLANYMAEMKMENRLRNLVAIEGTKAFVTMFTDTSDFGIARPKDPHDQRRHWSFKNRKFAHRVGICVSVTSGDLCHLTLPYPAGQCNDILVNRAEQIPSLVRFFERIGADGIYKCRTEPVHVTPHRKPKGGDLTAAEKKENDALGADRSVVENVFSRVKQWNCMRCWHHRPDQHGIIIRFVFQLAQVKNLFRPVRVNHGRDAPGVRASWREAAAKGAAPVVPPPPPRRARRRNAPGDGGRPKKNKMLPPLPMEIQLDMDQDEIAAQEILLDAYTQARRADRSAGARAERAARWAAR